METVPDRKPVILVVDDAADALSMMSAMPSLVIRVTAPPRRSSSSTIAGSSMG